MMSERMIVEFTPMEGATVRMLGLVERRGFRVCGLSMTEQDEGKATLTLDLEPRDAGRNLDILGLQILRLHGVTGVSRVRSFAQEKAA